MIPIFQKLITAMTALVTLLSPPIFGTATPVKDNQIIETTALRNSELNLSDTNLKVQIGTGYIDKNQITLKNNLRGKQYTDNEYQQIKDEIISAARTEIRPDEELSILIEMLDKECKGKHTISGKITTETFLSELEKGC